MGGVGGTSFDSLGSRSVTVKEQVTIWSKKHFQSSSEGTFSWTFTNPNPGKWSGKHQAIPLGWPMVRCGVFSSSYSFSPECQDVWDKLSFCRFVRGLQVEGLTPACNEASAFALSRPSYNWHDCEKSYKPTLHFKHEGKATKPGQVVWNRWCTDGTGGWGGEWTDG